MDTTILSVVRFELCNIGLRYIYIYIYYDNQHALMKKLKNLKSSIKTAENRNCSVLQTKELGIVYHANI